MAKFAIRYTLQPDRHGLVVITESGRCRPSDRPGIENGCTWRYEMVTFPHAPGAVLKALDGTNPAIQLIRPSTFTGTRYKCVKVAASVNPFAAEQSGGTHSGHAILQYSVTWQEVGGVA